MDLKPCYTVEELARLLHLPERRTVRLLKRLKVLPPKPGREPLVWLADLKKLAPDMWESLSHAHTSEH